MSSKTPISHDKNGRRIYPDSLIYDAVANEYFFPVKRKGIWGDDFMGDFYSRGKFDGK